MLDQVEALLREGRVDAAVGIARDGLMVVEGKVGKTGELPRLAEVLARVYRSLESPQSVPQFLDQMAELISEGAMGMLRQPMQEEFDLTISWGKRLADLANERLMNAMADTLKANDLKQTLELIQVLLLGTPESQRSQRAGIVARHLGGMVIERERAQQVVKAVSRNPLSFGLDPLVASDMEENFVKAAQGAMSRERAQTASSMKAELVQAAVELGRCLPGRMILAEPTEEQVGNFEMVLRALWRNGLGSPGYDWFHDVTALLVELSPKEVSAAGALAGVEQRLHSQLGRTARAVTARALENLGNLPGARLPYLGWLKTLVEKQHKGARFAIELTGLLHHKDAIVLLRPLLSDRKFVHRSELIFALGAIADPGSFDLLAKQLDEDLRGRVIEGAKRKEAFLIISALGRSTRSLDGPTRTRVLQQILRLLPDDDVELGVRVALNFFISGLDSLDRDLVRWAAKLGTVALWSADRPELARAGKNAMLGFRQPLVDMLARLQPHAGEVIRQVALDQCKQYQAGAYLGLGELWYKVADPEAVAVLRQLIFNAVLHEEGSGARSAYMKATVRDVATEQEVEIGKDRVLASLIAALSKCGTEEAEKELADLFEQAQHGRLGAVGQETSEILLKAHQKAGGTLQRKAVAEREGEAPRQLTEEDINRLNDLKATYWLAGSRRTKKVSAFAYLGQNKVQAALEPALDHLLDKDPIIATAAVGCLVDLVSGPGVPDSLRQRHGELMLRALKKGDGPLRVKVAEVIKKIGPRKEPFASGLAQLLEEQPPLALRAILESIVGGAVPALAGGGQASPNSSSSTGGLGNASSSAGGKEISALDKKRAYIQARQAWIKGGKKGPEPQPPE
jgi:HEAT repeat protein